jgi:nitric oxide reductase NorD protein
MIENVKDFEKPIGAVIRRRIMGLTPKFYTRLGAAIRHVSTIISKSARRSVGCCSSSPTASRTISIITKAATASRTRAARCSEARRLGQAVFAVTVDARAQDYIPYLFGQNGFAIVRTPSA